VKIDTQKLVFKYV